VDLSSPHVKNKMSKREFIRNTRGAVGAEGALHTAADEDLFGSLYDNVFLRGHVADQEVPLEKGASSSLSQATWCSW
jgi:F-box protein 8